MEAILDKIITNIIGGGPTAIISVLILTNVVLAWWIIRLDKVINKKDGRLDEVIDKVLAANIAVAESLNQLRSTIFELVKQKL